MALIEINRHPSNPQLRQFGFIAAVALPAAAWLACGRPEPAAASRIAWGVFAGCALWGAIAGVLALLRPQALRWSFVAASLITYPIGLVVGEFVLLAIYFLLFLPVSLIFRFAGRDVLDRRIDRHAASYWNPKRQPAGPESYFRQS